MFPPYLRCRSNDPTYSAPPIRQEQFVSVLFGVFPVELTFLSLLPAHFRNNTEIVPETVGESCLPVKRWTAAARFYDPDINFINSAPSSFQYEKSTCVLNFYDHHKTSKLLIKDHVTGAPVFFGRHTER